MKQIITAKLKLLPTPEQFQALRQTHLAYSVERQVAATYKGLWTKLKKNSEHRRKKITKKRFKGLDKPPKYSSPTVEYTYKRDYTFQRNQQVSLGTLNGRT